MNFSKLVKKNVVRHLQIFLLWTADQRQIWARPELSD